MPYWGKTLVIAILCILSALSGVSLADTEKTAVSKAGVLFLRLVNSPRANAMGECVVNLVDEQTLLYNPATLGLFHLDKTFSLSFPNKTKWLPMLGLDLSFKAWGLSGGGSYKLLHPNEKSRFNLSLGLSYFQTKLDYGTIVRMDELGQLQSPFHSYEASDNFSIGLGFDFRHLFRVGVGYTYKKINSHLAPRDSVSRPGEGKGEGKAKAHDFGLIAELSLHQLMPHKITLGQSEKYYLHFDVTPSFAWVNANVGDDISYKGTEKGDPLPKIRRTGFSLYLAANVSNSALFSTRFIKEVEKDLVETDEKVSKTGFELGLLNIVYFRKGRFKDEPANRDVKTSGWGFSSKGIVSWLYTLDIIHIENKLLDRFVRNLDFSYDYAHYDDQREDEILSDTKFFKIDFSF